MCVLVLGIPEYIRKLTLIRAFFSRLPSYIHGLLFQFYHGKPSTSALAAPVLPQLPALSGVMQIKPVPLKQRLPAM